MAKIITEVLESTEKKRFNDFLGGLESGGISLTAKSFLYERKFRAGSRVVHVYFTKEAGDEIEIRVSQKKITQIFLGELVIVDRVEIKTANLRKEARDIVRKIQLNQIRKARKKDVEAIRKLEKSMAKSNTKVSKKQEELTSLKEQIKISEKNLSDLKKGQA